MSPGARGTAEANHNPDWGMYSYLQAQVGQLAGVVSSQPSAGMLTLT